MRDTHIKNLHCATRLTSTGAAILLALIAGPAIAAESSSAPGLTVSERTRLLTYGEAADTAGDAVYYGEDARLRLESSAAAGPQQGGLRAPAGNWTWGRLFRSIADSQFSTSDVSGLPWTQPDQGSGLASGRPSAFLWQGTRTREEATFGYDFGFATGPAPYDSLGGAGQQKLGNVALATRFSIRPRAAEDIQTGVFFGYARIPLQGALAAESFKQAVGGAFINWENDRWRLVGQVSHVSGGFAGVAGRDSFVAALGQAEYRFSPSWTVYGRGELAATGMEDPGLGLYPNFSKNRLTAGMRFDLTRRHALSLEFASDNRFDQPRINQIDLRWRTEFK